ncbi:MAG: invasion associated locus B family protein [Bosea sp. (in: a-proteobacteria)]|nr:invasion associated locus B family protein [Bosea sp. (in: a-proteobacteria)]
MLPARRIPRRFAIKPAEVALPGGVAFGDYRRVIQPFENWTLICDENLKARKKVCNISQTLVDQTGETVFSWSLAATQDGKPMLIMRVPPNIGAGKDIVLRFPGKPQLQVKTNGCDARVCMALMPIGPVLRERIEKGASPEVSYAGAQQGTVTLNPPLKGLSEALAAIK